MAFKTGKYKDPKVAAPLVRKKRRVTYQPASVLPGIPHTIEGAPSATIAAPQGLKGVLSAWGDIKSWKGATKQFEKKQRARKRIKPIADPEAGQSERRRRAARRRMKGRLGTMLSERETLS